MDVILFYISGGQATCAHHREVLRSVFESCPHFQSPVSSCLVSSPTSQSLQVCWSIRENSEFHPTKTHCRVSRFGKPSGPSLGSPLGWLTSRSKHLFQRRLGFTRWSPMGAAQRKRSLVQADQRSSCRVQLTGFCASDAERRCEALKMSTWGDSWGETCITLGINSRIKLG